MIKKITLLIAVLMILFSFSSFANEDFYVYGKQNGDIAKALGITEAELESYCEQNKITYFAVNGANTKQIKRTELVDSFSQKTVDLSVIADDEILKFSGELSGFSEAKGEIVNHNGLKLLKHRLESSDSGGSYTLTQYITVKNAKKVILNFYTAKGESEEYIDAIFEEQFKADTNYKPFIIIGAIIFAFIGLVAAVLIIKELKNKDSN